MPRPYYRPPVNTCQPTVFAESALDIRLYKDEGGC